MLRRVVLAVLAAAVLGALPGPSAYAATDPADELAARYAPVVVVREQPGACGPR